MSADGIADSTIALGEVYEGVYVLDNPAAGLLSFKNFMTPFARLDVTEEVAVQFAGLRAKLRKGGNLNPDLCLLIAATALEHGLSLITRNLRHFRRIDGLTIHGVAK